MDAVTRGHVVAKLRWLASELQRERHPLIRNEIIDRFTQLDREHLVVTACVHPDNAECRAFCESAEFAITDQTGSGYDIWSAEHYLLFD